MGIGRLGLRAGAAVGIAGAALAGGPGRVWTYPADASWTATEVAMGDHGGAVFGAKGLSVGQRWLLSAFDGDPATPVWTDSEFVVQYNHVTDAADRADVFVEMHQVETVGSSGWRHAVLSCYRGAQGAPVWQAELPTQINGHPNSRVRVSADGETIVALVHDVLAGNHHLEVFGPDSAVPVGVYTIPGVVAYSGMALSDDGSTLVLSSNLYLTAVDVATGAVLRQEAMFGATNWDAVAVDATGARYAFGTTGEIRVYDRQSDGGYARTLTLVLPAGEYARRVAISADGRVVAAALGVFGDSLTTHLRVFDLDAGVEVNHWTATGAGSYQNVPSAVDVSDDGSIVAGGFWGDEAGLAPELVVLETANPTPLLVEDLPGSVWDVELSPDGQRLAVAQSGGHANAWQSGGGFHLYAVDERDLVVEGVPHAGGAVDLLQEVRPGRPAAVLVSGVLASEPELFPGMGTLYLERSTVQVLPPQTAGPDGIVRRTLDLPVGAMPVGTTFYVQAFRLAPRQLGRDYETLTVLP